MTLTGCAGVGKRTLALALAERASPRYRDGAWWVDLRTVEAPPTDAAPPGHGWHLEPSGSATGTVPSIGFPRIIAGT